MLRRLTRLGQPNGANCANGFANRVRPQFAKREWRAGWPRRALAHGAAGFIAAALGPYGTFEAMGFGPRAALWVTMILLGWAQFTTAAWLFAPGRPARFRPNGWQFLAITLIASAPTTLEVAALFRILLGGWTTAGLPALYLYTTLVGGLVYALNLAIERGDAPAPAHAPGPPHPNLAGGRAGDGSSRPPAARFLDRLPSAMRGPPLALEMEDHYLRAHTALGAALILYRMADAAAELGDAAGLRVHRSWWVAADAIRGFERRDGRIILRLVNGLEVPVSRAMLPTVRARGWLSATLASRAESV